MKSSSVLHTSSSYVVQVEQVGVRPSQRTFLLRQPLHALLAWVFGAPLRDFLKIWPSPGSELISADLRFELLGRPEVDGVDNRASDRAASLSSVKCIKGACMVLNRLPGEANCKLSSDTSTSM